MPGDHLGGRQRQKISHLGEVLTVVVDVDRDLTGLGGVRPRVLETADPVGKLRRRGAGRVEADEHGSGGGDQFVDTDELGCLQRLMQVHRRGQVRAFDEEMTARGGVEVEVVDHWR